MECGTWVKTSYVQHREAWDKHLGKVKILKLIVVPGF